MGKITAEEILQQKGFWCARVEGDSMLPMLKEGEDSIVVILPKEEIKKYDVVLIRKHNNLILHRITKVYKDGLLFVGDNCLYREKIKKEQIIGVLKEFYKGETLISVDNKKYRRYAFFRVNTYYFRKLWYKFKNLFKKKK